VKEECRKFNYSKIIAVHSIICIVKQKLFFHMVITKKKIQFLYENIAIFPSVRVIQYTFVIDQFILLLLIVITNLFLTIKKKKKRRIVYLSLTYC
jgi:hypothetical protein